LLLFSFHGNRTPYPENREWMFMAPPQIGFTLMDNKGLYLSATMVFKYCPVMFIH
jgi:hypothetical protein